MLWPMKRRHFLWTLAAAPTQLCAQTEVIAPRALVFPADFGAHPGARTEWWYLTGALQAGERLYGFQVTFFRSRTGLAEGNPSRFAAQQLVFAHAALSDVQSARQLHDQRIARAGFGIAEAAEGDTRVRLRDWSLQREGPPAASRYRTQVLSESAGFQLDLTLAASQPVLLQGMGGYSRKGPQPGVATHYYSQPQLAASGTLTLQGRASDVQGRAWLDHEWSNTLLDPQAVGWDWIGMNLDDGGALTAFRLRRSDGSTLYAGGSLRAPGGVVRNFEPGDVRFTPSRHWQSPASQARYPVQWSIETPAGRHTVRALFDAQELDSRNSTGAFYWEGLSELLDEREQRIGRGYLEMTGYAGTLRL
ncbi:MAG: carotenoid 1,2-hydratase [Rhizobacter sp.]|nr:carotenoid 1,2-hydratase [Rhizobacter sp.]